MPRFLVFACSGSTAGKNRGYRLRCEKDELEKCAAAKGGKACISRACLGGDLKCDNPDALTRCLAGDGGKACLGPSQGDCRE